MNLYAGALWIGTCRRPPSSQWRRLRDQLAELGLALDPVHYAMFAEAYLPIEGESALAYAREKRLRILVRKGAGFVDTASLSELGLPESWPEIEAHLASGWEYLASELAPAAQRKAWTPERWTAAANCENCD